MRFSQRGSKAAGREKPLRILLPGHEGPREENVLVRPVSGLEELDAHTFASSECKTRGRGDARENDAIYDRSYWAYIVSVSYLDKDSPENSRGRFFDGGAQEVLKELPTETYAYLFQMQQQWQEEISPNFKARSPEQLVEGIKKLAGPRGEVFFWDCSPSTQLSLSLFMAALHVSSADTSWQSGSPGVSLPTKAKPAQPRQRKTLRRPPPKSRQGPPASKAPKSPKSP